MQECLTGIRTHAYDSAFGYQYYVNSIADIITQVCTSFILILNDKYDSYGIQEMANPWVCEKLKFYPEINDGHVSNFTEAGEWLDKADPTELTLMLRKEAMKQGGYYDGWETAVIND